jgi:glycosyltransferase involved in cell wall biosynthesis
MPVTSARDLRRSGSLMRVLHVITGLNVGGAETMLSRLLERQDVAPDLKPRVATLMPPGFMGGRIAATGTPVHQLGMKNAASGFRAVGRLASLLRKDRPDLVIGWMHHAQLAASIAVRLSGVGVPVIWNVRHSLGGYSSEKPATRAILKVQARVSSTPAALIYNAHQARQQYEAFGFRNARVEVIPNGFALSPPPDQAAARARLEALFGIPRAPLLVGMVARAHPMKDVPNLVTAFARMLDRKTDAHLFLAGDGMDRPTKAVAAALAVLPRDRWTVTGQRSDVGMWLGGLDMLALPSAWGEGFPNIVGEAMLAGVPCVATDVGDTRWIIDDAGRVVPPGNPEALARALLDLAALGAAVRAALGKAARRRIETEYDLDRIAGRYAALCRSVVRSPRPAMAAGGMLRAEGSH